MIILDHTGKPLGNDGPSQDDCNHGITFDEAAYRASNDMRSSEVRKRWPRLHGRCDLCGFSGIYYASYLHYLAGDW